MVNISENIGEIALIDLYNLQDVINIGENLLTNKINEPVYVNVFADLTKIPDRLFYKKCP